MEDRPIPEPGPNEVQIKVKKTAICGTDLHIYYWNDWAKKTVLPGTIIGHEFVGEITRIGSHVSGFSVGDRVSGEGHLVCEYCRNCRAGRRHLCRHVQGIGYDCDGAFAEYLVLPAGNVFRLPAGISDDQAAILDPLGNATHTALSYNLVGEDVLITGAGPTGLMACAIARQVGARHIVITDVNPRRLEIAKEMGATLAIDTRQVSLAEAMDQLGMTEGFDVGMEMSGNATAFREMLSHLNYGGKIAMLGLFSEEAAVDWTQIVLRGQQIKGIYGREMYETWYKMAVLLQSGLNIDPVITNRFPIDEFAEAFEIAHGGETGKVILQW